MHNNHPIFESEDINDIYMSVPFNHLYRGVVDRDVPRINNGAPHTIDCTVDIKRSKEIDVGAEPTEFHKLGTRSGRGYTVQKF